MAVGIRWRALPMTAPRTRAAEALAGGTVIATVTMIEVVIAFAGVLGVAIRLD
jgi:hypothetical protein